MEWNPETLGQRIVAVARLAVAMHLDEVLGGAAPSKLEPASNLVVGGAEPQREGGASSRTLGGAELWARLRAARLTDGAVCFTDEASFSMDGVSRAARRNG
jgi:hypothetical protein